jgi:hypothetical protein
MNARVPVFRRLDLFEPVKLTNAFEPPIDKLPGAGTVGHDLTTVFPGTTAGAIKHMFGAPGNRTDTAVFVQHTGSAGNAFLGPDRSLFENTKEGGVQSGINRLFRIPFRNGLNAGTAPERKHRIVSFDCFGSLLDEHVVAMTLNGKFLNLERRAG